MQFWPPDDEHMCSKHVDTWNKTYCETKSLYIKLVNYWDEENIINNDTFHQYVSKYRQHERKELSVYYKPRQFYV